MRSHPLINGFKGGDPASTSFLRSRTPHRLHRTSNRSVLRHVGVDVASQSWHTFPLAPGAPGDPDEEWDSPEEVESSINARAASMSSSSIGVATSSHLVYSGKWHVRPIQPPINP